MTHGPQSTKRDPAVTGSHRMRHKQIFKSRTPTELASYMVIPFKAILRSDSIDCAVDGLLNYIETVLEIADTNRNRTVYHFLDMGVQPASVLALELAPALLDPRVLLD
ncbi:hypothetical protein FOL47_003142 [Perkinsus chesapeaki]|uniref:Uncharacterized protein n=1 Tax=Perkinsus chesapeaki TaxID=330153 RepID=A0A7J6M9L4_PERCH|nr:hypothetical protein FOL47_003142 [Perkinsus chesapeaki]